MDREVCGWRKGDRCIHQQHGYGTVRFVGRLRDGGPSTFVGVELDRARRDQAGHDGAIFGTRYFTCAPQHGLMTEKWRTHLVAASPRSSSPARRAPPAEHDGAAKHLLVSGLEGRAVGANGVYVIEAGARENNRPVYTQRDAGRSGPARLVYDASSGESPAWLVEVPNDPGKAYAYAEDAARSPEKVRVRWHVWHCPVAEPVEHGTWHRSGLFEVVATSARTSSNSPSSRAAPPPCLIVPGVLLQTRSGHKYRRGDQVEYNSVAHDGWVPAVVETVHADGSISVDRCDRVDPRRIRPAPSGVIGDSLAHEQALRAKAEREVAELRRTITAGDEELVRLQQQTLIRFVEMGFTEEAVGSALAACGGDRDRTIEYLLMQQETGVMRQREPAPWPAPEPAPDPEQAAREQEARLQVERDRAAREQAQRKQVDRDRVAREQAAREQAVREQAERGRAAREQVVPDSEQPKQLDHQLRTAAKNGKVEEMRQLLDWGADPDSIDARGYTALAFTAHYGEEDALLMLIKAGATVDQASKTGHTALMRAAKAGHARLVMHLLQSGASTIARNDRGKTALEQAREKNRSECIAVLTEWSHARIPEGDTTKAQREREALEQAAREQATREQAARQQAAQDRAAREQTKSDRAAREQAAREQAAREQAAKEQAAREQAERDRAARDRAAREQAAREQAAKDQAAREQVERDRAAREQAARKQAAREQAAKEQAAREQAERDRAARKQAARERSEREQAARDRAAREQAARELAERDRAAREQAAREQATREQAAREQAQAARDAQARQLTERDQAARGRVARQQTEHREYSGTPDGRVVKEYSQGGGQRVREYADGSKVVSFPDSQQQTTYADGTEVTVFASGQKQTTHTDGTKVTVFASGQKQTTYTDGTEVTVFAGDGPALDGAITTTQTTQLLDGTTETVWSDGSVKTVYSDGRTVEVLPSGEKRMTDRDGTTDILTPGGLKIPGVLRPSHVGCSGDYQDCDSRALRAQSGRDWPSVEQLAEHLAQPFRGNTEKMARVLFRWVAHNCVYDNKRLRQDEAGVPRGDSQSPDTVMRTGRGVCEGYSKLLYALCDAVGVHCKYIGGDGRGGPGDRAPEGHAWNALSFDDGRTWHLCDVCWAAGGGKAASSSEISGTDTLTRTNTLTRASSGSFTRRFTKQWWCTAPEHFVEQHLPKSPSDQLLERPYSKSQWERMEYTQWTPTTFGAMNDGDEVLEPSGGILRTGQMVEFRIFLNEDTPSTLKLTWGGEWGETLDSRRVRGGHMHSITAKVRGSGKVRVNKRGQTTQTSSGTSTSYDVLVEWKVQ